MHILCKHFWWFVYIRNVKDSWKAFALYGIKGICKGVFPLIQGEMVAALTNGTTAITAIQTTSSTGDVGKEKRKAELLLLMWLLISVVVYFIERVAGWYGDLIVPGVAVRTKFRFYLMGRMLKFKPLPIPGEAAHMMIHAVEYAVNNIWLPFFVLAGSQISVVTLFVILIVKHWGEFHFGYIFTRFILPICGLMVLIWFNYWLRRHASADVARRQYQWMSRVQGYAAAAAEFGRDRNCDLDQECTDFWRIVWSLRVREFHEYFWGVNVGNIFHFSAIAVAIPMIYITGTRVMNQNNQIEIGTFVTVLTGYIVLIDALNEIMNSLMKWPLGYEGVQRVAQVFNGSELKSAYRDPLTGLTTEGGVFLRELDLARLIRIDPAKLRTIDLRRIRRMNLDDLAPIEIQRLQTMGVDLPTLIKVSQLTEIVEQFQLDQHKNLLPTLKKNP